MTMNNNFKSTTRRKLMGGLTFVALSVGVASVGYAAGHGGGTTAFDARNTAMHVIVSHMKALGAVAKGEAPADASTVVHATSLNALAGTVKFMFPAGEMYDKSRAKPEIWSDWDGFVAASDNFAKATPALVEAAKTGDAGAIGAALGAVGKTCGGCHESYRGPEK